MKLLAKITAWILRSNRFTGDSKAIVMNALLDNLDALPIRSVMTFDQYGTLRVNGKELNIEQAIAMRDGAMALLDSQVRKLINEQITFKAVEMGVHNGLNPDTILFSKAALWVIQEEAKLLSTIAKDSLLDR